ncbi:hypothetical protein H632_c2671p0 [Helicosporidium sp. ATCC 50920]|nr:hypothetical protein H632_c2671p0 [Helicosporidium sp. ATCC 50920]|eukprot:KDD72976.1 hypothetical protein H632_c2671p0 [Helicosporidium sp. ATCC 50920]
MTRLSRFNLCILFVCAGGAATQTGRHVLAAGYDPYKVEIPPAYNPYNTDGDVPDVDEPLGVEPPPLPPYDPYASEEPANGAVTAQNSQQAPPKIVRVENGSIVEDKDVEPGRHYCYADARTMQVVMCE